MPTRTLTTKAAICLGLLIGTSSQASEFERRYLAVDESLHASGTTLNFTMGQASSPTEIFKADQTWEVNNDLTLAWANSVTQGPDSVYRMYYTIRNGDGQRLALATSSDGENWSRYTTNNEIAGSNILTLDSGTIFHAMSVFYDQQAGDYKLLWAGSGSSMNLATSNDGLNFTTVNNVAFTTKTDTQHTAFYDTIANEYRIYGRKRGDWSSGDQDRRGVPLHRSSTWNSTNWTNVNQTVIDPADVWNYTTHSNSIDDYPHGAGPDVYSPSVQNYHGQYIGLPSVFHRDPSRVPHTRPERVTGPVYPMVMHSLDGENWEFPDLDHPIIDLSNYERVNQWQYATNQTTAEVGQIYTGGNFIEVGDELFIFYKWRDDTHYEAGTSGYPNPYYDGQTDQGIAMQKLRADGFASLHADVSQTGQWRTPTISVPEGVGNLVVNANVAGQLQVEIRDSGGSILSGFGLSDSIAYSGNSTQAQMTWDTAQFNSLAGQDVQLRFHVTNGDIYSFWFAQAATALYSSGFDSGYSTGNLSGQNGWTTNGATQGSWQVITPSGTQPDAPEGDQYLAITKVAGQGSPRAYHDLVDGGGTLTDPFSFEANFAYSDIDDQGTDGIFLGAYLNDDFNSSGVTFGFTEIEGQIHLAYRDGNDYQSLGVADENTFYNFAVDVTPNGASTTYDIIVTNMLGQTLGSAHGAASRNGLGEFSLLQLAVGTGQWGGTLYVDAINIPVVSTPPTVLYSTGFDTGYSTGNLSGQNDWTTNGASQGSWQVITPSGNQADPVEGSQYLAITKVAGQGSPRAYHDLAEGGATIVDAFTFEASFAYSDIDDQGSDGIFLGAYLNDDFDSSGVIFGFKEIDGDIYISYRDGNDFIALALADENEFYQFIVDVTPDGSSTTYDILVKDALGGIVGSAQGAASRNGLDEFSLLQLAVGTGQWGGTLYVDAINVLTFSSIPEPASLALLGIGTLLLLRRKQN